MIIMLCPLSEKTPPKTKQKRPTIAFKKVIQNGVAAVTFFLHDNYVVSTQWKKNLKKSTNNRFQRVIQNVVVAVTVPLHDNYVVSTQRKKKKKKKRKEKTRKKEKRKNTHTQKKLAFEELSKMA